MGADHAPSLWSTHAAEALHSRPEARPQARPEDRPEGRPEPRRAHGRSHRQNVVPQTWDDRGAWLINRSVFKQMIDAFRLSSSVLGVSKDVLDVDSA